MPDGWKPPTWKDYAPSILTILVFATFMGLVAKVIDKDRKSKDQKKEYVKLEGNIDRTFYACSNLTGRCVKNRVRYTFQGQQYESDLSLEEGGRSFFLPDKIDVYIDPNVPETPYTNKPEENFYAHKLHFILIFLMGLAIIFFSIAIIISGYNIYYIRESNASEFMRVVKNEKGRKWIDANKASIPKRLLKKYKNYIKT